MSVTCGRMVVFSRNSTNNTDCHNIHVILLKVALKLTFLMLIPNCFITEWQRPWPLIIWIFLHLMLLAFSSFYHLINTIQLEMAKWCRIKKKLNFLHWWEILSIVTNNCNYKDFDFIFRDYIRLESPYLIEDEQI